MKIIIYPSSDNPYLALLYDKLGKRKIDYQYFNGKLITSHQIFFGVTTFIPRLLIKTIIWRLQDKDLIFHLHWPVFYFGIEKPLFLSLSYYHSMVCVSLIKALGYHLVWTVHNLTPHELATTDDKKILAYISDKADKIITHAEVTKTKIEAQLKKDKTKVTLIPLGNYVDVYPNTISQKQARQFLGIPDVKTILFFGEIKPYKGVDLLIDAHRQLMNQHQEIALIVSGRIWSSSLQQKLLAHQEQFPKYVKLNFNYLDNNDVQKYFNAADITAFPFRRITASSSLLVAHGFAKPTVIPDLAELKVIPEAISYTFKVGDVSSLAKTIKLALADLGQVKIKSKAAFKYASKFSWENIADKTIEVYKNLS